jgi:DNA-binding GntR family transcriptional regulator
MALSSLSTQLALDLSEMIADGRIPRGVHLREEPLAQQFGVSRSPLREALKVLAERHVVVHRANRGFFAEPADGALDAFRRVGNEDVEDQIYRTIAHQRLTGILPEQFNESDLARRFDLSRAQTSRITGRMAREGWIEPRPGYGWYFSPVLTTPSAFAESYRFRFALEPAAILEPTFRIDQTAFDRCRRQQQAVLEDDMKDVDPVTLFNTGSGFHEMLMRCSNNSFFLDAVQRVNRLRRLLEYEAMVEPKQFIPQAREHLEILDRIEGGDRPGAARLLAAHLDKVREAKLKVLAQTGSAEKRGQAAPTITVHF